MFCRHRNFARKISTATQGSTELRIAEFSLAGPASPVYPGQRSPCWCWITGTRTVQRPSPSRIKVSVIPILRRFGDAGSCVKLWDARLPTEAAKAGGL